MSIGIFAHSTNPRGGVVHALHLAEALCDAGCEATLLAPTLPDAALFRVPRCRFIPIPARPVVGVADMVARRIGEIAGFLEADNAPRFAIHHAQDPISANALAVIPHRFVRTVHHLDLFEDVRLAAWQDHAVRAAAQLCCVSRLWQERLQRDYGRSACVVGNGVDCARFAPATDHGEQERALRARLGLPDEGRVLLAIGGVEARKNTLNTLRAFQRLHPALPDLRLLIAGGASLLDHSVHRAEFAAAFAESSAAEHVHLAGVVADADMPVLYRLAAALVFPSHEEGFGLCVLEALASGVPAIVSDRAPFTEYLAAGDALFTDPDDPGAIAAAMRAALEPSIAEALRRRGTEVAARFGWDRVAEAHLPLYDNFLHRERENA